VGSSEPIQVDVRILAATHQDLERLIKEGHFREDLYYRLNVISIQVPPLRDRREDIAELAMHFLRVYAARSGKPVGHLDDDALMALKSFSWPGNIRQLENVIERAVVVAEEGAVTLRELPPELHGVPHEANGDHGEDGWSRGPYRARHTPLVIGRGKHEDREQRERERLVRALAQAKGNKAEAARALGLARSTLLSRLKKYGLN
jgi:DNA-binding NtrC family response regulator